MLETLVTYRARAPRGRSPGIKLKKKKKTRHAFSALDLSNWLRHNNSVVRKIINNDLHGFLSIKVCGLLY